MTLNSKTHRFKLNLQRISTGLASRAGRGKYKPGQFQHINLKLTVPNLGHEFQGYHIVHLSDIHLGNWLTPARLQGLVSEVNQLQPDLIVITGDYVSYITDGLLPQLTNGLNQLEAKDGVVSVLGNHDHWMGADQIITSLEYAGVINLQNQVHSLQKGNSKLHIAGLDDAMVGKDDLPELLSQVPTDDQPALLLAHEPDMADKSNATHRFFLQLSGHSHGGQIELPFIGTPIRGSWFKKYPVGTYQLSNMLHYTSRGVGTNIFRWRINCKPEITSFRLNQPTQN